MNVRHLYLPKKFKWKPETLYLAEVSFRSNNPVHISLLYSGFLYNNKPGNYSCLFNPSYERMDFTNGIQLHYLKIIKEILNWKSATNGEKFLLAKEVMGKEEIKLCKRYVKIN